MSKTRTGDRPHISHVRGRRNTILSVWPCTMKFSKCWANWGSIPMYFVQKVFCNKYWWSNKRSHYLIIRNGNILLNCSHVMKDLPYKNLRNRLMILFTEVFETRVCEEHLVFRPDDWAGGSPQGAVASQNYTPFFHPGCQFLLGKIWMAFHLQSNFD